MNTNEALGTLRELQRLAVKRYAEEPLPMTEADARTSLRAEIDRYDLARHIVDLEMNGYTILPPGKAAPVDFTDRLRDTILRIRDQRDAEGISESQAIGGKGLSTRTMFHLVPEDPVFEDAVVNPVVLTLVTYLAGYRANLTYSGAIVKSNEKPVPLGWHTDNTAKVPVPYSMQSVSANVNWMLTDYSRENGALCVVPGSHLLCREPDIDFNFDDEGVEVIEVPAGSVAVWHANLWHAALPRSNPGERVTLINLYERSFMQAGDAFMFSTTPEMIERNPPRFSVLMGLLQMMFLAGSEGGDRALDPSRTRDRGRWT